MKEPSVYDGPCVDIITLDKTTVWYDNCNEQPIAMRGDTIRNTTEYLVTFSIIATFIMVIVMAVLVEMIRERRAKLRNNTLRNKKEPRF